MGDTLPSERDARNDAAPLTPGMSFPTAFTGLGVRDVGRGHRQDICSVGAIALFDGEAIEIFEKPEADAGEVVSKQGGVEARHPRLPRRGERPLEPSIAAGCAITT